MDDVRTRKAMAHPTRVAILGQLTVLETASPRELADHLDIPVSSLAYHVRRLNSLGFLALARKRQRRGAVEHFYRLRTSEEFDARGNELSGFLVESDQDRWSELRVVLDNEAVAEMRAAAHHFVARLRQLETETVTRARAKRGVSAVSVDVAFHVGTGRVAVGLEVPR